MWGGGGEWGYGIWMYNFHLLKKREEKLMGSYQDGQSFGVEGCILTVF